MTRHLGLFSGVGGWELAARWVGLTTVGVCEIDPWCRRVLAKNFPGVPQHDDIRTLTPDIVRSWGIPEIITGSYPCQSFSVAGKRRGVEDDRFLWPEMFRLVDALRPRFVVAENVAGHINMGLDRVLDDLEAIGYAAGAIVLPAASVNAFHARHRVWILAHDGSSDRGLHGDVSAIDGGGASDMADAHSGQCNDTDKAVCAGRDATLGGSDDVPNPLGLRDGIQRAWVRAESLRHRTDLSDGDGAGRREQRATVSAAEEYSAAEHDPARGCNAVGSLDARADGIPDRLVRRPAPASELTRMGFATGAWENGITNWSVGEEDRRRKIGAMGNAIVPQVAYEILRVMTGAAA